MSSPSTTVKPWRDAKDFSEFCQIYDLPDSIQQLLEVGRTTGELASFLLSKARDFTATILEFRPIRTNYKIDTSILESDNTESFDDRLVQLYADCIRESGFPFPSMNYADTYIPVLVEYTKNNPSPPNKEQTTIQTAFHKGEKQVPGREPASKGVWDIIREDNRKYRHEVNPSPYTSIVGSSGTGKSFSVRSIAGANYTYVIYVSFTPKESGAYPSRSMIADWLLELSSGAVDERAKATTKFECFIAAGIRQVQACRRYRISPIEFYEMQVGSKAHYLKFQDRMKDNVERLYSEIKDSLAQTQTDPEGDTDMSGQPAARSHRGRDFRSDDHTLFDYGDYVTEHLGKFSSDIEPAFRTIAKKIKKKVWNRPRGTPSVIFCFDEAGGLLASSDLPFLALRRALRNQKEANKEEDFFAVLLDTKAKYNVLVPAIGKDPSDKINQPGRNHFLPIFEVDTFDSMSNIIGQIDTMELTTNIDLEELFSLGRPVWAVFARRHSRDVIKYATKKLYGGGNVHTLDENVLTTMMAIRVPLIVLWEHLAETLVADHNRMIFDIQGEKLAMKTHQPSEPILAWIAFKEIYELQAKEKLLNNFRKQCQLGSIDVGDIGEVVACLTLLYAFDKTQASAEGPKPKRVDTFMRSLFGKETFEKFARKYKSSYGEGLKELWDKGFVFFNHFQRLDTDLDLHVLRHAWMRGCALIAVPNTAHFDLAIPVLIDGKNEVKCLLIQVKNRKNDRMTSSLKTDAIRVMENAHGSLLEKNVDACAMIYMAMRTDSDAMVEFDLCHSLRDTKSREAKKQPYKDGYVIAACGLNEHIYPGLSKNENETRVVATLLRELLSIKDDIKYSKKTPYQRNFSMRRNY